MSKQKYNKNRVPAHADTQPDLGTSNSHLKGLGFQKAVSVTFENIFAMPSLDPPDGAQETWAETTKVQKSNLARAPNSHVLWLTPQRMLQSSSSQPEAILAPSLLPEDIWQCLETFLSPLRGGCYWYRGGGGQGCCLTHPWVVVPKTAQRDKELSSQNVNRAMGKKLFYNTQETTLVQ